MLQHPPPSSSRTCQASVVAVTRPCQKLWEERGSRSQQQLELWPAETTRPPSLPGLLQTPGKSEFLWKFKLCLLYQTGVGVGAALCQMVGMEGKRQLEGTKLRESEPFSCQPVLGLGTATYNQCRQMWVALAG